jgi:hypothetical protein
MRFREIQYCTKCSDILSQSVRHNDMIANAESSLLTRLHKPDLWI